MSTLIVSSRKRDAKTIGVQKYDNTECWNVRGGEAPNGVSATRWQRTIAPDLSKLSPLAAFLVTAGSGINVAGRMPHPRQEYRVVVYNGRTEKEQIMHEAVSTLTVNGRRHPDVASAVNAAEKLLKCYGSCGDRPQKISDWLFDIIEPSETDEAYINRQAEKMLAAGATRVVFNSREWRV